MTLQRLRTAISLAGRERRAAAMIEYALLIGLVALAAVATIATLGTTINTTLLTGLARALR